MERLKLTTKYKTYSKYRDSEVLWFKTIPQNWEISKARKFIRTVQSGVWGDDPREDNFDIACLRVADFDFDKLTHRPITTVRNVAKIPTEKILRKGDVLIEKSGGGEKQPVGRAIIFNSDLRATCANFIDIIRLRDNVNGKFFAYLLYAAYKVNLNSRSIKQNTGIQNLDIFSYFSEKFPFPQLDEQMKIVEFLDEKTALIERIIELKKKQIELLREKRTAVINQAVTKGLDQSVKLVDSDIDWLGKLSSEFDKILLKRLLSIKITDGPHTTPVLLDEGIPFISAESIQQNNTIDFSKKRGYISLEDHREYCKKSKPAIHDIFMVKSGATTGRLAIVETTKDFSIWSPLALIRADHNKIIPKYLYYFIGSSLFQDQVKFSWSYGTQQNIGMGVIENLTVLYPNIDTQQSIVVYLDKAIADLDKAILLTYKSITLLNEFKTSLISNVVTGKVKV